ncbi:MAG: glycosyltransferase [Candidatus Thiodiazotropha sp.]
MSDQIGTNPARVHKVSVILRTKDRLPLLREAVESVSRQNFDHIELVIVNDGGESIDSVVQDFQEQPFPIIQIDHESCQGRSAAANSGLEAATGEYLLFLDDDDLILPDHVGALASFLDAHGEVGAAYGDVEAVDQDGNVLHRYAEDFNPLLLMAASYLPIHAVMFRRRFVEQGLRFDTGLQVYEDWDFWIKLSEKTDFEHVPGLGGVYRNIGDSKVGNVASESDEILKNRVKLYEGWLARWNGRSLVDVFDKLLKLRGDHDRQSISLSEAIADLNRQAHEREVFLGQKLHQIDQQEHALQHKERIIQAKEQAIQDSYQVVDHLNRHTIYLSGEIEALRHHIEHQDQQLQARESELKALYSSTSWRMTRPLRSLVTRVHRLRSMFRRVSERLSGSDEQWPLYSYVRWLSHTGLAQSLPPETSADCLSKLTAKPTFSVVMPVYRPQLEYLREAIQSVQSQSYPHWELCIADDNSGDPEVIQLLQEMSANDERIHLVLRTENGHISRATNSALSLAQGDFVVLLDHDDRLNPDALLWVAREIDACPDAMVIYSDEDKLDEKALRCQPYFKGDWNYDLLLSHNMISHLGVYRRSLLTEIGGFRTGVEGSQDYDLALRCIEKSRSEQIRHIPRVLYHWRSCEGSTALSGSEKSYALTAAGIAIREHLDRIGQSEAEVIALETQGAHRVRYPMPEEPPMVSVVIVVDWDVLSLQRCVLSILDNTNYPTGEILIAYSETQTEAVDLALAGFMGSRWPVRRVVSSSGWSALVNAAVEASQGQVIALLSSAIQVRREDWLDEMVRHALRPDVGVAGARLFYANDSVQHAGLILKPGDFPGFPLQGPQGDHPGYFGRALLIQGFSVLSPACLVFQRKRFDEVGAMGSERCKTVMAGIDFCLKLRSLSYLNTWTPYAELTITREACYPFDPTNAEQKADLEVLMQVWNLCAACIRVWRMCQGLSYARRS